MEVATSDNEENGHQEEAGTTQNIQKGFTAVVALIFGTSCVHSICCLSFLIGIKSIVSKWHGGCRSNNKLVFLNYGYIIWFYFLHTTKTKNCSVRQLKINILALIITHFTDDKFEICTKKGNERFEIYS